MDYYIISSSILSFLFRFFFHQNLETEKGILRYSSVNILYPTAFYFLDPVLTHKSRRKKCSGPEDDSVQFYCGVNIPARKHIFQLIRSY